MIGADQLAAALDVAALDVLVLVRGVEAEHAATHPVARLEHGHRVARGVELEGTREPREARADHDHALLAVLPLRHERHGSRGEQQARRCGERRLQKLAALGERHAATVARGEQRDQRASHASLRWGT
jgi:hypothetical protein